MEHFRGPVVIMGTELVVLGGRSLPVSLLREILPVRVHLFLALHHPLGVLLCYSPAS